jgi:hypothetical protein
MLPLFSFSLILHVILFLTNCGMAKQVDYPMGGLSLVAAAEN